MKKVCGNHKSSDPVTFGSLGVAGQPRHGDSADGRHMGRGNLAHAARTGHPGAHAPVLETACQGPRTGTGSFEESMMRSDRCDGGDARCRQRSGCHRRRLEERVVHRRVGAVGCAWVSRHGPRVCYSPTSCRVEATVVSAAAVDLAHQALHLFQRVAQHQDVISRQEQRRDFGEFAHRRSVRVGHYFPESVHGHVEVVHPFPLAAVDFEADGLQFVVRKHFPIFLSQPDGEGLLVSGREAAQASDFRRGVALRGGHGSGEAVHGCLQAGHEDVVHLGGGGSARYSARI